MGKSKSETKQQQTVTPTNPAFVTRGVMNQQERIEQLGQRDPREFVAPASSLQNAAFGLGGGLANRMGATSFDFGNVQIAGDNPGSLLSTSPPSSTSPGQVSGGVSPAFPNGRPDYAGRPDLEAIKAEERAGRGNVSYTMGSVSGAMRPEAAGVQIAADQIGQPDYAAYVNNHPDLLAGYNSVRGGGFGASLSPRYDANGDGVLQLNEFGNFHFDTYGRGEGRDLPTVAGVSAQPTQQQALQQRDPVTGAAIGNVAATDLSSPNPNDFFTGAGLLAGQVGMSGANTVGDVSLSQAGQLGPAQGYRASGPAGVERGQAAGQAGVTNANVTNAQASLLGDPSGYAASLAGVQGAGNASQVNLGGYNAAQGQASLVGNLPSMQAAQITQADIDRFMNPYLDDVVSATEADMQEQFGQQRAALDARAAGAGAFGGSRFGVRESQLDGEQSRALGSTLGGLRADGFNTALNFADRDVGRRQDANASNFNLQGQRAFTDAAAQNQFGMANMDAQNMARAFLADAQNRGLLANADAINTFALTDAEAANRANLTNAGLMSDANRFGAEAANEFDRLNQQAAQQVGLANADAANTASRFNAGEANRSALDAAGRQDAMSLANMDAVNRSLLDFASRMDQSGQFNAGAMNDFARTQFGADTDANFRNADAINNMSQFNAGQRDANLDRRLQSAGLLGDLGATVGAEDRANIGLLADLGNQQREIDRAYRNADPTMAQLLGDLNAMQQFGLFQGQNSQGSSTTTNSQNAASMLAGLGGSWMMGGAGNPFSF